MASRGPHALRGLCSPRTLGRLGAAMVIPPLPAAAYLGAAPEVVQINVSEGGVPKLPIGRVMVDELGIAGDQHRDLKHHGGPERALCLFALELIEALRAEGHPIVPGAAGENLTTRGLDWSRVQRGRRLLIGTVLAEVTGWAAPCSTIAGCFADGGFKRMSQKVQPGWSRAYARVLQGGVIAVGDRVSLVEGTQAT